MTLLLVGDWLPRERLRPGRLPEGARLVGNLECAIGDRASSPKAHPLVLAPSAIDGIVESPFAALSLANNHAYDAGTDAFSRMIKEIQVRSDIQLYGLRQRPFAVIQEGSLRCAIIGCLERCRARGPAILPEEEVESLIRNIRSEYDRVFVTPHWGKEGEFTPYPSPKQRALAHRWLDSGADAVVGHHSHTVQGREWHGGRPIFYSIGNFIFEHHEGMAYPLTRLGLAVEWMAGNYAAEDQWSHRLLIQARNDFQWVDASGLRAFDRHWEATCKVLNEPRPPWTRLRWARVVGPVYIPKTRASWRQRMRNFPVATLPRWLVWCLLPCTLLLRLGNVFPDRDLADGSAALDQEILEYLAEAWKPDSEISWIERAQFEAAS